VRLHTVLAVVVPFALVGAIVWDLTQDRPVDYADDSEHFKYGSIGSEPGGSALQPVGGLLPPYWIFKVLPTICPTVASYSELGLIFERESPKTAKEKDLPIGISRRRRLGVDMVGVNCALCHAGTIRDAPGAEPRVILGMPPQQVNVQRLFRFVFECIEGPEFTAATVIREIRAAGGPAGLIDRIKYRLLIPSIRGRVRELADKIGVLTSDRVPAAGPGRLDTINPGKALELGWNLEEQLDRGHKDELIGTTDFPPVWNLGKRSRIRLHWDGNVGSVREATLSAALAVGAKPQTLDYRQLERVVALLWKLPSPSYPYPTDPDLVAPGERLFREHCARCHDFAGPEVGAVTPNDDLHADAHRLNSFSQEYASLLPGALNRHYATSAFHFTTFRKTNGYANVPLDGIWARSPYLHNGSVPTLRDLLEPERCRPSRFYRGSDVYDPENVGFMSYAEPSSDLSCPPRPGAPRQLPASATGPGGAALFLFDTSVAGNRNTGHPWGTALSADQKSALVEFLKTL